LQVSETLSQLDDLKKAIRQQFKVLTNQEMLVFSTLYQLEEQGFTVDYSLISQKLSLSESSIRDYILRIIKKGIPIQKTKENNKKVFLSISSDLKNIASLSTIIQLREL
jgi:predicted transcriptional regulator